MAGSEEGVPRAEKDHSEATLESEFSDWGSSESGDTERGNACGPQREGKDFSTQLERIGERHKELSSFCGLPTAPLVTTPDVPHSTLDSGDSSGFEETERAKPLQQQQKGEGHDGISDNLICSPTKVMLKPEQRGEVLAQQRKEVNSKLRTLSSLLPESTLKRDRFQILTDTLAYVNNKRQMLSELQQRHKVLSLASQQGAGAPMSLGSEDLNVKVLHNGIEDVVITVKCKSPCAISLMGALLRAIERFDMEVLQCNVLKSCGFFLCDAICKRVTAGGSIPPSDVLVREVTTSLRSCCTKCEASTGGTVWWIGGT